MHPRLTTPVQTAVLDANVLYPAHLRDVLLWLAVGGFYRPQWSDRIHDEWTRNLLANRPDLSAEQLAYTRGEMERAFPSANVMVGAADEEEIVLPDPDDRHVAAAAIAAGADVVVTFNVDDFPSEVLGPYGLEAVHPDAFVTSLLEADPEGVVAVLQEHRAGLRRPPLTAREYLGHLERAGLTASVSALRDRGDVL